MDVVITYVDGNDPIWKKDYETYTNVPMMQKRFRDWGTLKYLLRGVQKNMPFVNNVYLIVSHPSQVPQWADVNQLHVVLHEDIIPKEYLPTFNCNTIEMHLHRIKGLDEEYLYFNDDMFPIAECRKEDLFRDGNAVIGYYKHFFASGMYKKICRNSDRFARKALGMPSSRFFTRPQHICSPMLKSECERLYSLVESEIIKTSKCRTRTEDNLNQYVFLNYMNYKGLVINEKISNKHFSLGLATSDKLRKFLNNPPVNFVCMNDVKLRESRYQELRTTIIDAFESIFPEKSRFEI